MASLSSLTLKDTDLPVRPGFGTEGRTINLRTNFFPVKVPKGPLYEYDIKITPAGLSEVARYGKYLAHTYSSFDQACEEAYFPAC